MLSLIMRVIAFVLLVTFSARNGFAKEFSEMADAELIFAIKSEFPLKQSGAPSIVVGLAKQISERCARAEDSKLVGTLVQIAEDVKLSADLRVTMLKAAFRPGSEQIQKLIGIAKDTAQPLAIRRQTIVLLGSAREDAQDIAFSFLCDMVEKSKEPELVSAAIWGFYDKDYPPVVMALVNKLKDPNVTIKLRAIAALGNPNRKKPNKMENNPKIVPALTDLLKDSNPLIVNAVIRSLAVFNTEEIIRKFDEILSRSKKDEPIDEKGTRWTIVRALGDMKGALSEEVLLKSVDDPDDLVVAHAAEAIAKRNITKSISLLKNRLGKASPGNQYSQDKIKKAIWKLEKK